MEVPQVVKTVSLVITLMDLHVLLAPETAKIVPVVESVQVAEKVLLSHPMEHAEVVHDLAQVV